jgi:hypothetical protein
MQVRGARGPRARTYGDLTGKGKGQMPNRRHASDKKLKTVFARALIC